ncbi:MAG: hypothetical protein GTN99_10195 [Candidatus Dadabacteria bacterium]|nr:hypothetical protein [Candidatus Dadabacteria bacterium]
MPLQNWDDPQVWANAYKLKKASNPNEWADGYVRDCSMYTAAPGKANQIINALGIQSTDTVGVIGGGYGWIGNQIAIQTGCVVAVVDTSAVIQSGKAQNADVEIINADVTNNNGRNQVKQALGITGNNKASYMITEEIITCLDDTEATQLSTFLNNISNQVVHYTTEIDPDKLASGNQDPNYNWKTLEDWKLLLPNDLIMSSADYRVV